MKFAMRKGQMAPASKPSIPPSSDRYLEVTGTSLRYRDDGRGPAAVFVHGWTLDLDMWEPQAEALAGSVRVIRMDRRGYGRSSGLPSLADDVTDLLTLIRKVQIQRFALIGMSQGARVALRLAAEAPGLISCLILDGPPPMVPASGSQEIPHERYRMLARTHGMSAFRSEWGRHPLARLRTADSQAHTLLARMIERYPGNDLTDSSAPGAFAVDLPALAAHGLPTLVISGEHDLASRKQSADSLASALGAVQRAQIADAGHLCNLDNPIAYNQLLRAFLDRYASQEIPT
ncbi:MAG: Pimeloyl-ACP methyl ester carboxylesterase [Gammaproteobacteria bacterium]|nr:Pimeloyl-ACP methyl ester carboxylesterase [Gammaproteobacteria bacterium]